MSKPPILEVELYAFISDTATDLLTPHEFDVTLEEARYLSHPIQRSDLALGPEAAKSALELRVAPDLPLVRRLLDASLTGEATTVHLRTAHHVQSEDTDLWTLSGTRWMGRVLGVEITPDMARLRCESAQVSLKRVGLRRLYSRKCSHVLYSAACGVAPVKVGAVVGAVRGRTIEFDGPTLAPAGGVLSGVLSGALAGGWLETSIGTRHMILSESSNSVEVLYPVAITPGSAVSLVAGCDHTTATCRDRFNNLDNYGGFPAIPTKNPFATGVF